MKHAFTALCLAFTLAGCQTTTTRETLSRSELLPGCDIPAHYESKELERGLFHVLVRMPAGPDRGIDQARDAMLEEAERLCGGRGYEPLAYGGDGYVHAPPGSDAKPYVALEMRGYMRCKGHSLSALRAITALQDHEDSHPYRTRLPL